MNRVVDRFLYTGLEGRDTGTGIDHLIDVGRRQGYVSLEDIVLVYPEAEGAVDLLEDLFAALASANIPYIEDTSTEEPSEEELLSSEEEEPHSTVKKSTEDDLEHIDIDDAVGLYIREASRVPLLTFQEEQELAQRIDRGRLARQELAQGNVSPRRRQELSRLIEDGWSAREHLIVANSRLVISVAKKYMGRGVPFLDLIQEGNIGLMRATKKFDYNRGFKFSTYATWWIRQAITRALADQSRTIRVPVHMGDQISRMMRTQHQLKQVLGREPNMEEVAMALNVTPKKVEYMIQVSRRPLSLHTPVGEDEDEVLGDFIEDQEAAAPDETAASNLLSEILRDLLDQLPPREARILQLRYGLLDGRSHTLNEVGRKMGVTRERVRQIEAQALRRLRIQSVQGELRAYIE
jgi:RNA polymerase primary sigma factor